MENDSPEWIKYATKRNNYEKLDHVFHIAHLPEAFQIIEAGRIKAGLVYDESRLTTTRTSVSWFSANQWAWGSIYGSVQFTFDWRDLAEDRKIYWVEAIDRYNPHAYRFLLAREVDDQKLPSGVVSYDPRKSGGPLLLDGDEWLWNGSYTSEFMIDSDRELSRCRGIQTVSHNRSLCTLATSCGEMEWGSGKAATLLITRLLGRGIGSKHVRKALVEKGRLGFTAEDGLGTVS